MPTPFPGMDPYLEQPGIWSQVHLNLISEIQKFLAPKLRPNYYVSVDVMTYLTILPPVQERVGRPDVSVVEQQPSGAMAPTATLVAVEPLTAVLPQPEEYTHRYLEIRQAGTHEVITTIELLSPANKVGAEGREQYERKRLKILGSATHFVEIDLLRAGEPMPMQLPHESEYRILVSRAERRPEADVYLFNLRDPIPNFPIALKREDTPPVLPLNELLHTLYEERSYDLQVDYGYTLAPPLSEKDSAWAAELLG